MEIIVQKFGGTSVQSKENRKHVMNHIKQGIQNNKKVVVVVSAMGRSPEPYATDTLLSLAKFPKEENVRREMDMLMSCGETISSVVLTSELLAEGIPATALSGGVAGIKTDETFSDATITSVQPNRILHELRTHNVVVVAGFQGQTPTGEVTTLGRGGSDTTAASLGVALEAEQIEIYTDVEGIMTADPRIVKRAQLLQAVTYNDICHMAYQGSKVIHPRAVEIAMQSEVPLRVRSTYSDRPGTYISRSLNDHPEISIKDRVVTGFAHLKSITQIKVHLKDSEPRRQSIVFKTMAEAGISVDFINISPYEIVFTVIADVASTAVRLLEAQNFSVDTVENCAKISAVGSGMTGVPGVAARIVTTLASQNINILQSADSHSTIWVLISEKHIHEAMNALHQEFGLHETYENFKNKPPTSSRNSNM